MAGVDPADPGEAHPPMLLTGAASELRIDRAGVTSARGACSLQDSWGSR
jgi:hypothetical protein